MEYGTARGVAESGDDREEHGGQHLLQYPTFHSSNSMYVHLYIAFLYSSAMFHVTYVQWRWAHVTFLHPAVYCSYISKHLVAKYS